MGLNQRILQDNLKNVCFIGKIKEYRMHNVRRLLNRAARADPTKNFARGRRNIIQQAEKTATSYIYAHRRDRALTTKNHDTEAQHIPHL
jgi:hypothetical protein